MCLTAIEVFTINTCPENRLYFLYARNVLAFTFDFGVKYEPDTLLTCF